jgi:hypothetical protein
MHQLQAPPVRRLAAVHAQTMAFNYQFLFQGRAPRQFAALFLANLAQRYPFHLPTILFSAVFIGE